MITAYLDNFIVLLQETLQHVHGHLQQRDSQEFKGSLRNMENSICKFEDVPGFPRRWELWTSQPRGPRPALWPRSPRTSNTQQGQRSQEPDKCGEAQCRTRTPASIPTRQQTHAAVDWLSTVLIAQSMLTVLLPSLDSPSIHAQARPLHGRSGVSQSALGVKPSPRSSEPFTVRRPSFCSLNELMTVCVGICRKFVLQTTGLS